MINHHLHLGGYLVDIAVAVAAVGIGLVLHEIFNNPVQHDSRMDGSHDDLTVDREVNHS